MNGKYFHCNACEPHVLPAYGQIHTRYMYLMQMYIESSCLDEKKLRICVRTFQSIGFLWSSNVMVSGLTSINSQTVHVNVNSCYDVVLRNLKISAPSSSPNTDGIHVQSSTGVTISSSIIKTGDDCISIGQGSRNLWIDHVDCGPGHGIRYSTTN